MPELKHTLAAAIALAVDSLDQYALDTANGIATAYEMPLDAAYESVLTEFLARVKGRSPAALAAMDGRTSRWRARVRLYRSSNLSEPDADSDNDLPAEQPGTTICAGLPAVADNLAWVASAHHGQPCIGLDPATLRHRLKSLRPTLSRNKGRAAWRVPYRTADGEWMARVDVLKIVD